MGPRPARPRRPAARRLLVLVGSTNPVKVRATRAVFRRVVGPAAEVRGVEPVRSTLPQPWDDDTIRGALRRAEDALAADPRAHLGVGIEAGLFRVPHRRLVFDVQYCAIVDRRGRITIGHGPGFVYPPEVLAHARRGATVGDAARHLYGRTRIGRAEGMIGFLTGGIEDRTLLTERSVLMALVPRIRPRLYRRRHRSGPRARRRTGAVTLRA